MRYERNTAYEADDQSYLSCRKIGYKTTKKYSITNYIHRMFRVLKLSDLKGLQIHTISRLFDHYIYSSNNQVIYQAIHR